MTIAKNLGKLTSLTMHTVCKVAISFGLVTIPVKLHAATEDKGIKLRQIHDKYRERLEKLIEGKIPKNAEQPLNVINLMEASVYLFGRNVATYKFTLAKSLLELSQQNFFHYPSRTFTYIC